MSAIPQKATGEIHIRGGVRLQGKVKIQGSKNAALPILAATILAEGESCLKDCPKISDVYRMLRLLQSLGGHVRWEGEGVCVSTGSITTQDMPADAITGMRSSLCLLGALLARCGSIVMEYPGGCVIGKRPIDLHLQALEQMGVCFHEEEAESAAGRQRALRRGDFSAAAQCGSHGKYSAGGSYGQGLYPDRRGGQRAGGGSPVQISECLRGQD